MAEKIQQYEILSRIGIGATGTVHRGRDTEAKTDVAIKILNTDLSRDQKVRKRFIHEAKTLQSLKHENIAQVLDVIERGDNVFMVMEYVPGKPLGSIIGKKARPLAPELAVPIIAQVLRGTIAAHSKRMLHGNLKPSDVLVSNDNRVKVEGFGLVPVFNSQGMMKIAGKTGKLPYMSPEQVKDELIDDRSDVYSIGMMLYQMLSGYLPYADDSSPEIYVRNAIIKKNLPSPPIFENLPAPLVETVRSALAKQRGDRPTTREFLKQLQRYQPEQSTTQQTQVLPLVNPLQSNETSVVPPTKSRLAFPSPFRSSEGSSEAASGSGKTPTGQTPEQQGYVSPFQSSPPAMPNMAERRMQELRTEQDRQRIATAARAAQAAQGMAAPNTAFSQVVPEASTSPNEASALSFQQRTPQTASPQVASPRPAMPNTPIKSFGEQSAASTSIPPTPEKKGNARYFIIGGLLAGGVAVFLLYKVWQDKPWQAKPQSSVALTAPDSTEQRLRRLDTLAAVPEVHADVEDTIDPGPRLDSIKAAQLALEQKMAQKPTEKPAEQPTTQKTEPVANEKASQSVVADHSGSVNADAKKKLPSVLANLPREKGQALSTTAAPANNNATAKQEASKPDTKQLPTATGTTMPAATAAKQPTSKQTAQEKARQRREELKQRQAKEREAAKQHLIERREKARAAKAAKKSSSSPKPVKKDGSTLQEPKSSIGKKAPATNSAQATTSSKQSRSPRPRPDKVENEDAGFKPSDRRSKYSTAARVTPRSTSRSNAMVADSTRVATTSMPLATPLSTTPQPPHVTQLLKTEAAKNAVMMLRGHLGMVQTVSFSPDGKYLASGGSDKTVKLWDPATGKIVRSLRGHSKGVTSVFFSPDGKYVMSGSPDRTVQVWNVETGERLQSTAGVSCVGSPAAFSPDGKMLATIRQKEILLSRVEQKTN